jgi:hypothetical protein
VVRRIAGGDVSNVLALARLVALFFGAFAHRKRGNKKPVFMGLAEVLSACEPQKPYVFDMATRANPQPAYCATILTVV